MSFIATAVNTGAIVGGGVLQHEAARRASRAQERAAEQGIEATREGAAFAQSRLDPFSAGGQAVQDNLLNLLGLQRVAGEEIITGVPKDPGSGLENITERGPDTFRNVTPEEQAQNLSEINPIVDILRAQGFEQIQEQAAAQGRLSAGGTLQDLVRFNNDLSSVTVPQLQNQRFNQLFGVSGQGQNAAIAQGNVAVGEGTNIANLLGNVGQAQSNSITGRANAITGTIDNLAGMAGGFGGFGGFGGGTGGGTGGSNVSDSSNIATNFLGGGALF